MRPRHTRRSDPELAGPTIQTAIRVPEVQRNAAQEAIEAGIPGLHSFTDVVVDALWLWLYEQTRQRHPAALAGPTVTNPGVAATAFTDGSVLTTTPTGTTVDTPRPESNGRPAWSDVDPALLEDS